MRRFHFLDDALDYWAGRTPTAAAISLLGRAASYSELNERVDSLAAVLLSQGVDQGDRVVLHARKSVEAIAAIYAVVRIGAIYVPIDPTAPLDRCATLIEMADPKLILADDACAKRLVDLATKVECLSFSGDLALGSEAADVDERKLNRTIDDSAYILMTSGSTGSPKGILHTHKSGMAYATMAANLVEMSRDDRVSHHTPLNFDMSIFDVFATAQAGACVVVMPEAYTKMPASLSKLVQDEKISVWYSVPFALAQFVERGALDDRDLSALRLVMFAGEKMPPAILQSFARYVPNAIFMNAYGPTETNHCTTAEFRKQELDGSTALPIGHPDVGVAIRIGDGPEPATSGELLVASDQLMQGYWNDAERTNAAFVLLPDESGVSRRFYRTGDIVEQESDGTLNLVGRADRQVKLRGFRIELDEIELSLNNAPSVSEAAVVLQNQRICAFVSGRALSDLSLIKTHIAKTLPPYAIPEEFISLERLDRTATGKIDRNALIGHLHA